jgi:hypothetical protein
MARLGCAVDSNTQHAALLKCWELVDVMPITSVRAHGVRQLLVNCLGKREGDWPCHHSGTLPIDRFQSNEALSDIERAADRLRAVPT